MHPSVTNVALARSLLATLRSERVRHRTALATLLLVVSTKEELLWDTLIAEVKRGAKTDGLVLWRIYGAASRAEKVSIAASFANSMTDERTFVRIFSDAWSRRRPAPTEKYFLAHALTRYCDLNGMHIGLPVERLVRRVLDTPLPDVRNIAARSLVSFRRIAPADVQRLLTCARQPYWAANAWGVLSELARTGRIDDTELPALIAQSRANTDQEAAPVCTRFRRAAMKRVRTSRSKGGAGTAATGRRAGW